MKLSPVIIKETTHIAVGTVSLTAVMLLVFLVVGKFSMLVLGGAIVTCVLAIINFFLMCLSKQKELNMSVANTAKNFSILSYNVRILAMLAIIIVCYFAFDFNLVALLIPTLFPRITILIMSFTIYRKKGDEN